MPRGRKVQHKGRGKRYLTEEEIRIAEEKKRREKGWKLKKGLGEDSDEEESEEGEEGAVASKSKPVASKGLPGELPPTDSSEEEEDSEEEERQHKQKGVDGLIEVVNPNRQAKKAIKARNIDIDAKVELTRREREEIEKQRAAKAYAKRHVEGKTEEAQRDLARLAIIKQQREDAAKKREEARREEALKASKEQKK